MAVRVRKRGQSWYVYSYFKGQRQAQSCKTRDVAETVAKEIRLAQARGAFGIPEPTEAKVETFQEVAEEWLERYAKRHCRPATYEGYARLLRQQAFPLFGATPFEAVSRRDVEALANSMADRGLSKSTIKFCVGAVRGVYNDAIDHGAKLTNPAARPGKFLKDKTDRRLKIVPLTAEEVERLLRAAQEIDQERADRPMKEVSPSFHLFLLTAVRTGLRLGELMGLQWGDLDFAGRFIDVKRQWNRGAYSPTKSGKGRRVDMSLQLSGALRQAMDSRRVELAIEGKEPELEEPIFRNSVSKPLQESNVRRRLLAPCLQRAGLRQIHPHVLRHTLASLLLSNGEPIVYVKEQLGHASIQLTVDTYGHLIPGANKAAVDRLDDPSCISSATNRRATTEDEPRIDVGGHQSELSGFVEGEGGDPSGTRTPDALLKRQELYRLS
jgi:integrase